jgi:hypothetical protein
MKTKLVSLFFILILMGCEKRIEYIPDPNQKILFQLEYINYALSFQHSGWMIVDFPGHLTLHLSKINDLINSKS